MAITGIGSNYNNVYESTYTSQKNEAAKKTETNSVSDYYSYLQKNFDCVKNGNVAISGSYLKECANNPEKAKELEKNLAIYKESYKRGYESAKANAKTIGARLTNYSESWSIDSTGNITMQASATVVSDTKGWRELKEERDERIKEKREQEEKEKKLKEKKEQEEIREKDKVSEDAVLIRKERSENANYPTFDMNI